MCLCEESSKPLFVLLFILLFFLFDVVADVATELTRGVLNELLYVDDIVLVCEKFMDSGMN